MLYQPMATVRNVDPRSKSLPENPDFLERLVSKSFASGGLVASGLRLFQLPDPRRLKVVLKSNDYLCLARHPKIIEAEIAALRAAGHGDLVSRVFEHGHEDAHRQFERRIARLMDAEDSVLCMSGYNANVGLIQCIAGPETPVYIDLRAHVSLWQGIASAGAVARFFRHNDPVHLERQIREHGPGVVVVDALYSTTGAIAPLAEMAEIVERHGCVFVVDETHSFGAQGPRGAGIVSALGLQGRVHFRTVGLSKAMAGRGGVIVCSERNAWFFRYEALPMIFSTTVLGHEVAGFHAALDIVETEQWRRDRLAANHARIRQGLDELGYNVSDSDAQIIGLEAGSEDAVVRLRDALYHRGIAGAIFCYPATPRNRAMVRLTVNCGLTPDQVDHLLASAAAIRTEVGLADWPSTRRKQARMPARAA